MNLILAMMLLGSGTAEAVESTGTILMNISGFESNDGQVVVGLITENEWSFPPDPSSAELSFTGDITSLSCDLELPDIPSGEYVAVAFHDVDRDGVFDREDEAVGMSGELPQMSAGNRSMPSFSDMSFTHSGTVSSANITVRKMERPEGGPGGGGPGGGGPGGGGGGRPGGF